MNRVILYHALLPGPSLTGRPQAGLLPHWTAELAYARRSQLPVDPAARARSLLGIALALRALTAMLGREVGPAELVFDSQCKPRLRAGGLRGEGAPDFSIAHAGRHVAVATRRSGCIGLDLEDNGDALRPTLGARLSAWIAREAVLKAAGLGLRDSARVVLQGDGSASLDGSPFELRELHFAPDCQVCVASDASLQQIEIQAQSATDVEALLSAA
jgi:phosphopantetheinyl transferase